MSKAIEPPLGAQTWLFKYEAYENTNQNTFAAMDAVDRFRLEANRSMAQTVQVLKQQSDDAAQYLERSRRRDGGDASAPLY